MTKTNPAEIVALATEVIGQACKDLEAGSITPSTIDEDFFKKLEPVIVIAKAGLTVTNGLSDAQSNLVDYLKRYPSTIESLENKDFRDQIIKAASKPAPAQEYKTVQNYYSKFDPVIPGNFDFNKLKDYGAVSENFLRGISNATGVPLQSIKQALKASGWKAINGGLHDMIEREGRKKTNLWFSPEFQHRGTDKVWIDHLTRAGITHIPDVQVTDLKKRIKMLSQDTGLSEAQVSQIMNNNN